MISPGNSQDHFVLMYHHVGDLIRLDALRPYVVSKGAFKAQMDIIEGRGLQVSTLRDIVASPPATRHVVLTFDDCSRELLDFVLPELERRSWKATFFSVAGKVGEFNDWDSMPHAPRVALMNSADLRGISVAGHEVGAHGLSHTSLREFSFADAGRELVRSRMTTEQQIGAPVVSMAYPYGEAPNGYRSLCANAGYKAACSIFSMSRTVMGDPYAIRRILVTERDTGYRMRAKLSAPYLAARARLVDPDRLRAGANRPEPVAG